jgi:hypothetical protein
MPDSKQLKRAEDLKNRSEAYKYEVNEKKQVNEIYKKLKDSWEQQNQPMDEHDGQSLLQAYQSNRLAANSFLTPVANDGEVRVVTGTTEGKLDSVYNAVYNQNLESEVRAFDEYDIEDIRLGDSLTKVCDRTGEIEKEDDFYGEALRELLVEPAVFIQETMADEWYYDRQIQKGEWQDLWDFKIPTFKKEKWFHRREPRKVIWTLDQVFLADHRIPARLIHLQPHIITYRTRTIEEAELIYGKSQRWEFVKNGVPAKQEVKGEFETSEWRFARGMENTEVEEIIYKSLQDDELQVILNGVPMLPVGCPLLHGRVKQYDMTMEVLKTIHPKYAYGRSMVDMVKTLQALKDEDFRLMILERRQDIWAPVVTKANTILSKDMWLPAAITYGISKDDVETLIDRNRQVDNKMSEIIENEIEKFINVSSILQGISEGKQTAHEVSTRMRQSMIMLGNALTSYMRMKRNCTYLRLYTIINEMTQPVGTRFNDFSQKNEDVYKTYTCSPVDLYDGKIGTEIISFINRKLMPQEKDLVIQREKESDKDGRSKRYTFLPAEKLKKLPYMFYVDVVAKEKRTSLVEREIYKKDLVDSIKIGQMVGLPINPDYIAQEWSKRVDIDGQKMFAMPPQDIQALKQQLGATGQQGGGSQNDIKPAFGANEMVDVGPSVANPSAK